MKMLMMSGDGDKVHPEGGDLCHGRPPFPPVKKHFFYDLRYQPPPTFSKTKHSTAGGSFWRRSRAPKRSSERKTFKSVFWPEKNNKKTLQPFFSILEKIQKKKCRV